MEQSNTYEFISKSHNVHNNKYDYSLTTYINNRTPVIIICPIHGEFEQIPKSHLSGHGCKQCGRLSQKQKMSYTLNDFIEKSKILHNNKYDYSLTTEYINGETQVPIICPIHGVWYQKPRLHLKGYGCTKCSILSQYKTTEQFIHEAYNIHGNKYDYSLVNYKHSHYSITIICPIHGEFKQSPQLHLRGSGCKKCKTSKGENKITTWMNRNNIKYHQEYKFEGCVYKRKLPFDFFIPSLNICIEYDGEQHYINRPNSIWGRNNNFQKIQIRDSIKNKYCHDNGILLIRIPYWDFENIDEILYKNIK